jgi:hypothetical protein
MNVNSPLKQVLDRFQCKQTYPTHQVRTLVKGLQKLINDLTDGVDKIGLPVTISSYRRINEKEEEVKKHLDEVKNIFSPWAALFDKKQKINLFNLETIQRDCSSKNQDFDKFKKSKNTYYSSLTIGDLEKWVKQNFNKNLDETLNEAFNKCERLKNKIKLTEDKTNIDQACTKNFMLRIENLMSSTDILERIHNLPEKKYNSRVETYKKLKDCWAKSYAAYKSFESAIDSNLFPFQMQSELSEFSGRKYSLESYFTNLTKPLFENLCISFLPTPECNLNFSQYLRSITDYEKHYKAQFEKEEKNLNEIEKLRNDLRPKVIKILEAISQKIESMKKQITAAHLGIEKSSAVEDKGIDSFDEKNKNQLQDLLNPAIESLELLKEELTNQWNSYCLAIENLKFQKEIFISFKDITENLRLCYLLAENIHATLRTGRKDENDINKHISNCLEQYDNYAILCYLISNVFPSPGNRKVSNEQFNGLLQILKKNLDFELRSEHQKVKALPEFTINCCDAVIYGSDKQREKIEKELTDQMTSFNDELKKQKEIIRIAFTEKLQHICDGAAKGINKELTAFRNHGQDPGYYNCFTQAFPYDNPVGNALYSPVRAIRDTGYSMLGNAQDQKIEDEAALLKILQLKDVVSPFKIIEKIHL